LRELPGPHRGGAEIAGLARLDDVVQGFHRLLGRGLRVEAVDLVQVDVVGAQAGQRGIDLLHYRPPGQAGAAGTVAHREVHLGRQHHVLAAGVLPDRAAGDLLGRADAVSVGGIPERDPELDGLPEDRLRLLLVQRPLVGAAGRGAEAHAAERYATDLEARDAQPGVFHSRFLTAARIGPTSPGGPRHTRDRRVAPACR